MTKRPASSVERTLALRTCAALLIIGLGAALALTVLTLKNFEQILLPQVTQKSSVIASSVRTTVQSAIELGIPFESLVGMEDFLTDTLLDNAEIEFIQVKDLKGHAYTRYRDGSSQRRPNNAILEELPPDGAKPGVTIGVRASYVEEKLHIMFGDAAVVSLVAVTAGIEIALFFSLLWVFKPINIWVAMLDGLKKGQTQRSLGQKVSGPFSGLVNLTQERFLALGAKVSHPKAGAALKDWNEPQARDVRLALFLFVFAEELLRSFLPIYVKDIASTKALITVDIDIALPIMAYMLFAGLGTLFGGGVVQRLGLRNAFKWSVIISTLGLGGLAFATTVLEVVSLRAVCALGYAVATVTCQIYIAQTAQSESSTTRGLTTFVAAVTAASLCGAPIGAVIAELIGIPGAMIFGAAMALCSWLLFRGLVMPQAQRDKPDSTAARATTASFSALLKNRRVWIILLCDVASGKLMLAGLLFYLTPILLLQYRLTQTSIGQFFMFYYVTVAIGNWLISRANPNTSQKLTLMMTGSLLTGSGGLLMVWFNTPLALAGAITLLGVGQSLVLAPAMAVLLATARTELPHIDPAHTLALARTFDRIGGILGAALVAVLSLRFDYQGTVVWLGIIVILLALGNLGLAWPGHRSKASV
jgi:predicted MFS family arabinose efflux permease